MAKAFYEIAVEYLKEKFSESDARKKVASEIALATDDIMFKVIFFTHPNHLEPILSINIL